MNECFEKEEIEIALALPIDTTSKRQDLIAFVVDISKTMSQGAWTFAVWDKKTLEPLYDPSGIIKGGNAPDKIEKLRDKFAVFEIKDFSHTALFYGVKTEIIRSACQKTDRHGDTQLKISS